jgi:hypothetical protein
MGLRAHEMPQRFEAAGFPANPAAFLVHLNARSGGLNANPVRIKFAFPY